MAKTKILKYAKGDKVNYTEDYSNAYIIDLALMGEEQNYYTVNNLSGSPMLMLIPEDMLIPFNAELLEDYPQRNEDGTWKHFTPDNLPGVEYDYLYGRFSYDPKDNGTIIFHNDAVFRIAKGEIEQFSYEIFKGWCFFNLKKEKPSEIPADEFDILAFGEDTYQGIFTVAKWKGYNLPSFPKQFQEWFLNYIKAMDRYYSNSAAMKITREACFGPDKENGIK